MIRPDFVLRLGAALFAALAMGVSWWRWYSFQYTTFDLAFYVQGLWLALHGQLQVSLLGVPLLGNHAEPIVFLLLPLFALCPHPMLLVGAQVIALASMPFTAARILRRREGGITWAGCALALSTVLAPATGYVAIHEFHPEALATPLLLLLYEARLVGNRRQFWLWFFLTLACKENIALLLAGFFAVHLVLERSWRRNLAPLLISAVWLGLYALVISPWLNAGRVAYGNLYAPLGEHPFSELAHALYRGIAGGNLLGVMLLSFALTPLLRLRWLLIAAPILLQHLLSTRSSEWTIYFHYAAPLLALFWLAAAETLPNRLAWLPAAICVLLQPLAGPIREVAVDAAAFEQKLWERNWKAPIVARLKADPALSVTAGLPYLSHLACRPKLYSLHFVLKGLQTLSRQRYEPDYQPGAVLIDGGDPATFNKLGSYYHPAGLIDGERLPSSDELLHQFLARRTWKAESVNNLTLLMAGEPLPPSEVRDGLLLYPHTKLTETHLREMAGGVELEFGWKFPAPRTNLAWLSLELHNRGGHYVLGLGPCVPEATGEGARQRVRVLFPPAIPPGRYEATAQFRDEIRALWRDPAESNLAHVSLGSLNVPSP